ncbi:MAG TPA: hypothetical protein PLE30_02780 [Candidatus Kapabacteria bacterium]|nr:hypothetical protein [Candidatus Kapabacteria bacterium]
MRYNIVLIMILLMIVYCEALSVNENNTWIFGYNAGLSFSTPNGVPKPVDSSALYNFEGSASISDSSGNLLFYTDGINIFNRNNQKVNSEDSLMYSHLSATQSALIVPIPNSKYYYIFTTDAGEYYIDEDGNNYVNKGLNYTKIRADNNNIRIDSLNVRLLEKSTEKISATKHKDYINYWVVSRAWGNDKFYIYLVNSNGIALVNSQSIGQTTQGNWRESIGYMKFSADSKYLAFVNEGRDYFELFKFDNNLGVFSEALVVPTPGRFYNYGIEFSAHSNFLYITESKNGKIYRYDISKYNVDDIVNSESIVYTEKANTFLGALQIAPNEKIYFSRFKSKFLGVIESPDSVNSKVIADAAYLGNYTDGTASYGLPNMIQSNNKFNVVLEDTNICQSSSLKITPKINYLIDNMKFKWDGPNNFQSSKFILDIDNISFKQQGKYYLTSIYADKILYDSINIIVLESPLAKIEGPNYICGTVPVTLASKFQDKSYRYKWNTGSTNESIEISKAGQYILTISNANNCISSDTMIVKGSIVNVSLNKDNIEAGKLCPKQNYTDKISIKNNELSNIEIAEIYSKRKAIVVENLKNIILKPEQIIEFDVNISSPFPIIINDSLLIKIKSSDCIMEKVIYVHSRIELETKLQIDNFEKAPGDSIDININLTNQCNNKPTFKSTYTALISYNSEYIYLDTVFNARILDRKVIDTTCYLLIQSDEIDFSATWKNVVLKGIVMTGGNINSSINIEKITWSDSLINTEIAAGSLKIKSCAINIRPIKIYQPSSLVSYQNRNGDWIIKYKSEAPGEHNIFIYDIKGSIITKFNLLKDVTKEIDTEFVINKRDFVTGIYIICLKNVFYSTHIKQIILK